MRIAIVIELDGLEGSIDTAVLAANLSRHDTNVVVLNRITGSRLSELIQAHGVAGLVIACRDRSAVRRSAGDALHNAAADRFALEMAPALVCAGMTQKENTKRAELILAAAAARVREYEPVPEDNLRLRLVRYSATRSRRALLTPPALQYEALPAVDTSACLGGRSCGICAPKCAEGAIRIEKGAAAIDKTRCRNCGTCIAACPAAAIVHPQQHRAAMDAGLAALLADASSQRRIVAFACPESIDALATLSRGGVTPPDAILPFEVPSAGFVDPYLVLRAFDLGATGVAIVGCGEHGRPGCEGPAESLCAGPGAFLDALGFGKEPLMAVVGALPSALLSDLREFVTQVERLPQQPLGSADSTIITPGGRPLAQLLAGMHERLGPGREVIIESDNLPFGRAVIDVGRCSLCGLCASSCPPGALSYAEDDAGVSLQFEPGRCVACELCTKACPEQALVIDRRLELAALTDSPSTLLTSAMARCGICNSRYAPEALLQRIQRELGQSSVRSAAYCPDCRLLAAVPSTARTSV